ncbi:MAG: mechanosensitive ion channel [Rhodospirillales bacterium]|nr:mechanosensitive ion channel [Rhodospirillales bacterium]
MKEQSAVRLEPFGQQVGDVLLVRDFLPCPMPYDDIRAAMSTSSFLSRFLTLVLVVSVLAAPGAFAQDEPTSDPAAETTVPTAEELDALIATLEDDASRQAFIYNLQTLADAQRQVDPAEDAVVEGLVARLSREIAALDDWLTLLFAELDDGSAMAAWFVERAADGDFQGLLLEAAWQVVLTLGLAGLAMFLIGRLVNAHLRALRQRESVGWFERPLIALGRLGLRIIPIGAFVGVACVVMLVGEFGDLARIVLLAAVNAIALTRTVVVIARTILAPLSPQLRAVPLSDRQAAYLYVWLRRFVIISVYGAIGVGLLASLGLPDSSVMLLRRIVGLVLLLLVIVMILQSREAVATWIRDHPRDGSGRMLRHRLADIWHILAMIAVVMLFAVWAFRVENGFHYLLRAFGVTGLAIFGALLATTVMRHGIDQLFSVGSDIAERFPGLERRSNRYVHIAGWLLSGTVWFLAAIIILEAWGLEAGVLLVSDEGLDLLGRIAAVLVIGLVAVVAWELGDGAISSYMRRSQESALSPRLKTLLPLIRNVLVVVIATIAVITVLAEIGLDIAPLLAGAGVVGLAIGFGAQALVKDVITGAFILFEDQFSVGDWIDAGGKMGGVESISIRTVKMRDIDGYVHTVPYGEITALTNMMRDFGFAVIDIGIAYQENTDTVIEVIKEVDAEARKDAEVAEKLSGELEVLGVNELGDSSVTVRVRVKTLAGYQWGVRREYLRRIKLKFDEVGIEIPFPHMTVYFGEIRSGTTPPAVVRIDAKDPAPAEIAGS